MDFCSVVVEPKAELSGPLDISSALTYDIAAIDLLGTQIFEQKYLHRAPEVVKRSSNRSGRLCLGGDVFNLFWQHSETCVDVSYALFVCCIKKLIAGKVIEFYIISQEKVVIAIAAVVIFDTYVRLESA